MDHERIPPHDLAAERALLGSLLAVGYDGVWDAVKGSGIKAEHFYHQQHAEIFKRIAFLSWEGKQPDCVTVADWIAGPLKMPRDAAAELLLDLVGSGTFYPGNARTYADRIVSHALRREMIRKATQIVQSCYEEGQASEGEILAGAVEDLTMLRDEAPGRAQFVTIDGEELFHMEPDPRTALVSRVLNKGDWMTVMGEPKAGKSLLALDLACSLASGTDDAAWCGFHVHGPRRVIYLVGEGGRDAFLGRWKTRAKILSKEERRRIHLWFPSPTLISVEKADEFAVLKDETLELGAEVVVMDPLIFFHQLDENSTSDMRTVSARLLEYKAATGAALVVVHHTRKKTAGEARSWSFDEGRGSSVLRGAYDAGLLFGKASEDSDDPVRKMIFETRNSPDEPSAMLVQLDKPSLSFETVAVNLGGKPAEVDIDLEGLLEGIRGIGEASYQEIKAVTGVSIRKLQRWLPDLLRKKMVGRRRETSRAPYKWHVPDTVEVQPGLPIGEDNGNA